MPISIDFETHYDDECSISTLGWWHYTHHKDFVPYLVSFAGDDWSWAGPLSEAPWDKVNGEVWLSHNALFDESVFERAVEMGLIPETVKPSAWHCTMDLCGYLGVPRSLAKGAEFLLGVTTSKKTRDDMKGVRWETCGFKQRVIDYARKDAELCYRLWMEAGHQWPEWERKVSLLTRRQIKRGVYVDVPLVEDFIVQLEDLCTKTLRLLPWVKRGEKPASYPAFCKQCREEGIDVPPSLSKDDEGFVAWMEKYGDTYEWAYAMRAYVRANSFLSKFKTLRAWVRPDGRASLEIKYCGAHTRRASGGSQEERRQGDRSLNAQAFSRDPVLGPELIRYGIVPMPEVKPLKGETIEAATERTKMEAGVEMRRCIIAPPGKKIVAADKSQVEPRTLACLCGDKRQLELMAKMDIYEAAARTMLGYDRPETLKSLGYLPEFDTMRRLAKAVELGAGYQCGPGKFVTVAWTLAKLRITPEESVLAISKFRKNRTKVVDMWNRLHAMLRSAARNPKDNELRITLPSGNVLRYRNVRAEMVDREFPDPDNPGKMKKVRMEEYTAVIVRGGKMQRVAFYGGKICENCLIGKTLVGTKRGWVSIQEVKASDLIWDGVEYVRHSGVVSKGQQPTVCLNGVWTTTDHRFLTTQGWKAVSEIDEHGFMLLTHTHEETELARTTLRLPHNNCSGGERRTPQPVDCGLRLRGDTNEGGSRVQQSASEGLLLLEAVSSVPSEAWENPTNARHERTPSVRSVEKPVRSVLPPHAPVVAQLRCPGDNGMRPLEGEVPKLLGGHGSHLLPWIGFGPDRQQSRIRAWELPVDNAKRQRTEHPGELESPNGAPYGLPGSRSLSGSEEDHPLLPAEPRHVLRGRIEETSSLPEEVFDILDCGPRNRFAVRGGLDRPVLIAHNCTQSAARDIFMLDLLRIEEAGHEIIMQTHDEAVLYTDLDVPDHEIEALMSVKPDWMPDIVLAAEAHSGPNYAI